MRREGVEETVRGAPRRLVSLTLITGGDVASDLPLHVWPPEASRKAFVCRRGPTVSRGGSVVCRGDDVEAEIASEAAAVEPDDRARADALAGAFKRKAYREVAETEAPEDPLGPSEEERASFSDFAKRRLAADS